MNEETMNNDLSDQRDDDPGGDFKAEQTVAETEQKGDSDSRNWIDEETWPADDNDESEWKSSAEKQVKESGGREIKVALDWVELEGALENNSPELHSFLNTVTGDVIRIFEGGENADARLKQVETSPDYIYIEPVSSREQYRWMEEFIEIVEESTLKDKLNIAIDGKGAFRRFKDVLVGYPTERERWFAKRSVKLRAHMIDWLASKNVIPTNTPPWEGEKERPERSDDNRKPRAEAEPRNWRENGSDLRTIAHELVDLVPSRELPTAVAFLEFLRGRRGFRRSRFG